MLFGCILLHCFEYRVPKLNKQVKETVGGWMDNISKRITIHYNTQ